MEMLMLTCSRIQSARSLVAGTLWQHDEDDAEFWQDTTGPQAEQPSKELILVFGCSYPKSEAEI